MILTVMHLFGCHARGRCNQLSARVVFALIAQTRTATATDADDVAPIIRRRRCAQLRTTTTANDDGDAGKSQGISLSPPIFAFEANSGKHIFCIIGNEIPFAANSGKHIFCIMGNEIPFASYFRFALDFQVLLKHENRKPLISLNFTYKLTYNWIINTS